MTAQLTAEIEASTAARVDACVSLLRLLADNAALAGDVATANRGPLYVGLRGALEQPWVNVHPALADAVRRAAARDPLVVGSVQRELLARSDAAQSGLYGALARELACATAFLEWEQSEFDAMFAEFKAAHE